MGEQKTERRAAQNNDEINNLAEFKNHAFFPRFFFSIFDFIYVFSLFYSNVYCFLVDQKDDKFNEPVH